MLLKAQDFTPSVYYNESRDFQFLGRLFDVVLNSVKTNADMLYSIPLSQDSDSRLLQLMTLTLGFKPRHEYNNKQLKAFCSAFAQAIRYKGSAKAFDLVVNALANSQGLDEGQFSLEQDKDSYNLYIELPTAFKGKTLLRDILSYILPAGMTCEFKTVTKIAIQSETQINLNGNDLASLKISGQNPQSFISKVVSNTDNIYTPMDDHTLQPLQSISMGDIRYTTVIDNVVYNTIEPDLAIDFGSDILRSGANDTTKLFDELSAVADKTEKTNGGN